MFNKRIITTFASIIIFAALLVWVWGPEFSPPADELWSFEWHELQKIEIQSAAGHLALIYFDEQWWAENEAGERSLLDPGQVKQRYEPLTAMKSARTITETPSEQQLILFGLKPPERLFQFTLKSGMLYSLKVGSQTPVGQHYYIQAGESEVVLLVSAFSLNERMSELTGLLPAPTPPLRLPAESSAPSNPGDNDH